jgi:hypothetical protein
MCNPRQQFGVSESRAVDREHAPFDGASTPRGRDASHLAPARIPPSSSGWETHGTTTPRSQPPRPPAGGFPVLHAWSETPAGDASESAEYRPRMGRRDLSDEHAVEGVATAGASFVAGPAEVAMGKVAVLLVCACDAMGVPVPRGGDAFMASVHGPAACRTEVRDLLDGRYEVRVATPSISGEFRVAVTLRGTTRRGSNEPLGPDLSCSLWGVCGVSVGGATRLRERVARACALALSCAVAGRAIGGSPHALHVLAPIAHYQHVEARGAALEVAQAGELSSFELLAHDVSGNRMTCTRHAHAVIQMANVLPLG